MLILHKKLLTHCGIEILGTFQDNNYSTTQEVCSPSASKSQILSLRIVTCFTHSLRSFTLVRPDLTDSSEVPSTREDEQHPLVPSAFIQYQQSFTETVTIVSEGQWAPRRGRSVQLESLSSCGRDHEGPPQDGSLFKCTFQFPLKAFTDKLCGVCERPVPVKPRLLCCHIAQHLNSRHCETIDSIERLPFHNLHADLYPSRIQSRRQHAMFLRTTKEDLPCKVCVRNKILIFQLSRKGDLSSVILESVPASEVSGE